MYHSSFRETHYVFGPVSGLYFQGFRLQINLCNDTLDRGSLLGCPCDAGKAEE